MTGGSGGVEIPGPGRYGARPRLYPRTQRATSGLEPARTIGATVSGLAVEAGQRRVVRYGVSRLAADAAPGRCDRAASGPPDIAQPLCPAGAAHAGARRPNAADRRSERTPAHRFTAGEANGGRAAIQQPHRASSLSGL